jgi:hypothetical protein
LGEEDVVGLDEVEEISELLDGVADGLTGGIVVHEESFVSFEFETEHEVIIGGVVEVEGETVGVVAGDNKGLWAVGDFEEYGVLFAEEIWIGHVYLPDVN